MPAVLPSGVTLYVVRHGETDWNAEFRYQGQQDIPLNDRGRAQAHRNGLALAALLGQAPRIDFVASPLSRAQETMAILRAALGLPPTGFRTDPLLREVNYGHWEGQLASALVVSDAAGIAARDRDPFRWLPRNGESYAQLTARTDQWLSTVRESAVVVTHGGVMRTLRGSLFGLDEHAIPRLEVPQDRVLRLTAEDQSWH